MSDPEHLEADGLRSEQQMIMDQAAQRHRRQKNDELKQIVLTHQCKAGTFCLVKQARLEYEKYPKGEHEVTFFLPDTRFSTVYTVDFRSVRLGFNRGPSQGSLRCFCTGNPDCLYTLVKTLCGLRETFPVHP